MKELLLSKGFVFDDNYVDKNYYVYESTDNKVIEHISKLFDFTNDGTQADLLIVCDEDFKEFAACCYSDEKHYSKDDFFKLVERM